MENLKNTGVSRRGFIKKGAVVAGGVAALSMMSGPAFLLGQQLALAADGDLAIVTMNAGLENLAVKAYQAAASLNLLDKPVLDVALAFADQHAQHQKAFEAEVKRLGGTPAPLVITKYPPLKSQADILSFAQTLELAAAGTYFIAIGKLQDPNLVTITASIMPIEIEHATIISAALKQDTIPTSFPKGKTQAELDALIPTLAPAADKPATGQGGASGGSGTGGTSPSGAPATGGGASSTKKDDDYTGVVTATLAAISVAAAGALVVHKRNETTPSEKGE